MRYFIVVAEDHADMDATDVMDALDVAGFKRTIRSGTTHDYDVAEAHHVQQLIPVPGVHAFAAQIDLERE